MKKIYGAEVAGSYSFEFNLEGLELDDEGKKNIKRIAYDIHLELSRQVIRNHPEGSHRKFATVEQLLEVFEEPVFNVEEVENEYRYDPWDPWLIVLTRRGFIKIGWRKRVIVIEWNNSSIKESAEELFPDLDVTKNGKMIHAWGHEQATEIVSTLMERKDNNE